MYITCAKCAGKRVMLIAVHPSQGSVPGQTICHIAISARAGHAVQRRRSPADQVSDPRHTKGEARRYTISERAHRLYVIDAIIEEIIGGKSEGLWIDQAAAIGIQIITCVGAGYFA